MVRIALRLCYSCCTLIKLESYLSRRWYLLVILLLFIFLNGSRTDNSKLNIYYQNVRGLRTKTIVFFRNVCACNYDIIIITETWLLDSIKDAELFDNRYVVWRRDRNYNATGQTLGGGVLIAVRRDVAVSPQPTFCSNAEDLWLTLVLKQCGVNRHINLHICVVYLCKENKGFTFSQQLTNFFDNLNGVVVRSPHDKYLIVGDFNLSNIMWTPSCIDSVSFEPLNFSTYDEHLLVDEINTLGFGQFNGIRNAYGRTLDLVLSNGDVKVADCSDDSLVPIDQHHGALTIEPQFTDFVPLNSAPYVKYIFNKGNYDAINAEISEVKWQCILGSKSLEAAVDYFYTFFLSLRDKYIPCKTVATGRHYPKWFSPALKKCLKEKYKFQRKFRIYGNSADGQSFKLLRDRCKTLEKQCYRSYISSVENSLKDNPKMFWSFVKSKSNISEMPCSMEFSGSVLNTGSSICNAFSEYFNSNFLDGPAQTICGGDSASSLASISDISVDINSVSKLLSQLDPWKSAGPDQLPAQFLIRCSKTISLPVSILFTKSLEEGTMPSVWKRAYITPVHKKGSRSCIMNYRPISKLCIISKVFERIVYNQLYSALKQSFSSTQHGFLKGRSVVTNLVLLNDSLTSYMDSGCQVDVVYTDYSKAFDRIQHDLLVCKLQKVGISGDLLRWLTSYINNRSQAVVVKNYMSGWVRVPSGVPQGSLLAPLLFAIFINDIEHCFKSSQLLCFADDMKIFAPIFSISEAILLQNDLMRLDTYCTVNQLDLNPSKCSVITFSRKRNLIDFDYCLRNTKLQRNSVVRDLGVLHDSKLLFDSHVDAIISKAFKALGFVMRNSREFGQAKTLKILYCSFVRSHLEYASQVWSPRYLTYISRIENVQRRFVKYLCFRTGARYDSSQYLAVCKKHHLLPLDERRQIADVVFLNKIAIGVIDSPELVAKVSLRAPSRALRFNPLLYVPPASSNFRQNAFLLRASNSFNSLSKQVDIDLFNTGATSVKRVVTKLVFDR